MITLRHIFRLNAAKLPPLDPQNLSAPLVVGSPAIGESVSVDPGSWIDSVHPPSQKFLLGVLFGASVDGLNGHNGFQSGQYEERIFEEGTFQIVLPNAPGSDGASHLDRFLVTATPKRLEDAKSLLDIYRPGDEWIEIWDESQLLFVGTPLQPLPGRQQYVINGSDPAFLLKKTREFWEGHWVNAPRDVWEHYTSVWTCVIADDFPTPPATRFTWSNTTTLTTADNRWRYVRAEDGPAGTVRLRPGNNAVTSRLRATADFQFDVGLFSAKPFAAWRVETQFTRPTFGDNAYVRVGLWDADTLQGRVYIQFKEQYTNLHVFDDITGDMKIYDTKIPTDPPGPFQVVVEGRERWIYFYVNQTLFGVVPMFEGPYNCVPYVETRSGDSDFSNIYADFQHLLCRRTQQFLMNGDLHGDYHLRGALPSGGLNATYYDDIHLMEEQSESALVFIPNHKYVLSKRTDPILNFNSGGGDWWPYGTKRGLWWSVRWTGAIKLNLADSDVRLRYTTMDEGARMWVAKTRRTEEYLDNWLVGLGGIKTGGSLRTHIGTDDDGDHHNAWYPIKIEYGQRNIAGAIFSLEYSIDGGSSWHLVTTNMLSTYGIFEDTIRLDSHSEVLKTLMDTFALQARMEPRPMEHQAFPGEFVPRNRVGRDTNKVIDAIESLDYSTQINAEGVADTILSDGAGIADSTQTTQLTLEGIQFNELEQRMMVMSEYESFGDVANTALLDQRINSLLALRYSPWEEVNTAPSGGHRHEYVDAFPMTGDLAEFFWRPGDGVRLWLPEIAVQDGSPRQILGVQRTFVPEGLGAPTVSFRQRPRNLREFMRNIQRRIANKGRNYQGQVVRASGTAGSLKEGSVVALPSNVSDVSRAEVVVLTRSAVPLYVYVNGVKTGLPAITEPGTYDITAYVARNSTGGASSTSSPSMKVELKTS